MDFESQAKLSALVMYQQKSETSTLMDEFRHE